MSKPAAVYSQEPGKSGKMSARMATFESCGLSKAS